MLLNQFRSRPIGRESACAPSFQTETCMQQYAKWCLQDSHQPNLMSLSTNILNLKHIRLSVICQSTGLHIFHVHPPSNESGYGPRRSHIIECMILWRVPNIIKVQYYCRGMLCVVSRLNKFFSVHISGSAIVER